MMISLPEGYAVWDQVVAGQAQYIATPMGMDGMATVPVLGQPVFLVPVPLVPQPQQRVKVEQGVAKRQQRKSKPMPIHATSICSNCHTTQTTLWRRSPTGEPECK